MSKEYLNGAPEKKPEKEKGFASNKNTVLLSTLIVLVLAIITATVIIFKTDKKGDGEKNTQEDSSIISHGTTALSSVQSTNGIKTEQACPICGSKEFTPPEVDGYRICKSCGIKWMETGDKIIVIQGDERTELSVTQITAQPTETQKITDSIPVTETDQYNWAIEDMAYGSQRCMCIITAEEVYLREKPDPNSKIVKVFHKDEIVYPLALYYDPAEVRGDWGYCNIEGLEGFFNLNFAEVERYKEESFVVR